MTSKVPSFITKTGDDEQPNDARPRFITETDTSKQERPVEPAIEPKRLQFITETQLAPLKGELVPTSQNPPSQELITRDEDFF
jgi:hypothetical protein